MSAFFVNREVIHDTLQLWQDLDKRPRSISALSTIGRRLWAMNREALQQRYPSIINTEEDAEYKGCADHYMFHPPQVPLAQLVKSANCLLYQCSEGNIGEGNDLWDPLYRALKRLCDAAGEPEGYDAASWDRVAQS